MSEHPKSIVVIPTYDEADNIQTVIDRVRHAAPRVDVLVVDDNSPDGTAAIVESQPDYLNHVFLLRHGEKAGLGAAYRAGFHWALNWHYDLIVQMDADLSHPPERVPPRSSPHLRTPTWRSAPATSPAAAPRTGRGADA